MHFHFNSEHRRCTILYKSGSEEEVAIRPVVPATPDRYIHNKDKTGLDIMQYMCLNYFMYMYKSYLVLCTIAYVFKGK
jgi:hypothetical protein